MPASLDIAVPFVAKFEGYREHAYPDPASPLARATVGARWGFEPAQNILDRLPPDIQNLNGDPYTVGFGDTGKHVTPDTKWSRFMAEGALRGRLQEFLVEVSEVLDRPTNANQMAAMVSLAYNIGTTRFRASTLLRKFNAGDIIGAADQFLVWNRAGKREMEGLTKRRRAERELFLGGVA